MGKAGKQIPYVDLTSQHKSLRVDLLDAIAGVIDRSQFILGEEVQQFEQRFAELCGVRFAVAVNSGTDALVLALRSLGIGPGDEVVTVPNSFLATASSIILVGAHPVFVDVRDDYNIDPAQIERAITSRTKAILPVHLTGRPADMEPIMKLARAHGLHVVEDCAQAVLAEYRGQRVGSLGTIGCFSFHPLKTLSACGDGGAVTTSNEKLYQTVKVLRNHGLEARDDCVAWGANSRLDTLHAAILLVKINYLGAWTEKRRANVAFYQNVLAGLPGLRVPADHPYEKAVYHTFVVQADRRNELKQYLAQYGIGTAIHYPIPIHLQKAAAGLGYSRGSFPVAERQAERILSLPVYPELNQEELDYVAQAIRRFYAAGPGRDHNSCG
jgi:dTDP-4-amino-4,6-dideoxygalactose transaminase